MHYEQMSDGELIGCCRREEDGAWQELVDRFSRYVWAIAVRAYRLPPHDAEDVFQEVFARAYQHLGSLRNDDAIQPWIGQLTRRLAIDRLRRDGRELAVPELPEDADQDVELERLAVAMDVQSALRTLPEHCREILDRFFARDESYETIGTALRIPAGTIASRISRCLGKLRSALDESTSEAAPATS